MGSARVAAIVVWSMLVRLFTVVSFLCREWSGRSFLGYIGRYTCDLTLHVQQLTFFLLTKLFVICDFT